MSALTETHHVLCRSLRGHARRLAEAAKVDPDAVEVDGTVERYHRTDGYRAVRVSAPGRDYLVALWDAARADVVALGRNVRIYPEVHPGPEAGRWTLDVTAWRSDVPDVHAMEVKGDPDGIAPSNVASASDKDREASNVWWLMPHDVDRALGLVEAGLPIAWRPEIVLELRSLLDRDGRGRVRVPDEDACPDLDVGSWAVPVRSMTEGCGGISLLTSDLRHVANLGGVITDLRGNLVALRGA